MKFVLGEPIYALSSPPGEGAISVLRLSGKGVFEIVASITEQKRILVVEPRKVFLEHIVYRGERIDQVLVVKYVSPSSYTGEDMVEIYTHGNPLIVEKVFEMLEEKGARIAEPGEFTYRAFANGKMSLEEAESVNFLIRARTLEGVKSSLKTLEGKFHTIVEDISGELLKIAVQVETFIEFPEEDVETHTKSQIIESISSLKAEIERILEATSDFKMMLEGVKVVLAGAPNAGKSSLFNVLVGRERAIVTDVPGTTRDYIEAHVSLNGYPFVFYDTAGIRETGDTVEKAGIELTFKVFSEADLVLFLVDASRISSVEDVQRELKIFNELLFSRGFENVPVEVVVSKSDLLDSKLYGDLYYLKVSSITGDGIDDLKEFLVNFASSHIKSSSYTFALSGRVISALRKVIEELDHALEVLKNSQWEELAAEHLRIARGYLAEITGEDVSESLLDGIFSTFCIGK